MVLAMFAMLRPITMSPPGGQAGIGTYSRGCTYGIGKKKHGRPETYTYSSTTTVLLTLWSETATFKLLTRSLLLLLFVLFCDYRVFEQCEEVYCRVGLL